MGQSYVRPLVQYGVARADGAVPLADGVGWFTHVEVLERGARPRVTSVSEASTEGLSQLTQSHPMRVQTPRIMGIVNTTPDSFSDGGLHAAAQDAIAGGLAMASAGAEILDIGGESTRPGASPVEVEEEITRTAPVIEGLRAQGFTGMISIDTRKAAVARAALAAGADLINDVSGFTHDADLAGVAAQADVPVCVMHGPVDPATMHLNPRYDDVVLDVYDWLEGRITALEAQGISRSRIIADPGIGFAKTLKHNLALLQRLSIFHGLGVPILLGASRKRFIGTIGNASEARARMPGSIAVALAGLAQGVQIVRMHDVAETAQAFALWRASGAGAPDSQKGYR